MAIVCGIVCWFDLDEERRQNYSGKVCKGCQPFVRKTSMPTHGASRVTKKRKHTDEEMGGFLHEARNMGIFSYASDLQIQALPNVTTTNTTKHILQLQFNYA